MGKKLTLPQTEKITYKQVVNALTDIVKEAGEGFVYVPTQANACMYTDSAGEPSCIVGHYIKQALPDLYTDIHAYEWEDGEFNTSFTVESLVTDWEGEPYRPIDTDLRDLLELEAIELLQAVQTHQDRRLSWGESLKLALEMR